MESLSVMIIDGASASFSVFRECAALFPLESQVGRDRACGEQCWLHTDVSHVASLGNVFTRKYHAGMDCWVLSRVLGPYLTEMERSPECLVEIDDSFC